MYNNKIFGCEVKCFVEKPSGTAGALKAKHLLEKEFFLSNGDTLIINIFELKNL